MEIKITNYKNKSSLISSIIVFIMGGILFTNPDIFITTISKIIGLTLLLISIVYMIITFTKKKTIRFPIIRISSIVILLLLAILFLFFSETVEKAIRIIVGFWILFSGIEKLINALKITVKNKSFISLVIVSIILIAIGIYTIVIGDIVISTIGIILMLYSFIDIVGYIFYAKDTDETVTLSEDVTLLTTKDNDQKKEKPNKKTKKIKDVSTENKDE